MTVQGTSTASWQDIHAGAGADHPAGAIVLPTAYVRNTGARAHAFAGLRHNAMTSTFDLTISVPPPGL